MYRFVIVTMLFCSDNSTDPEEPTGDPPVFDAWPDDSCVHITVAPLDGVSQFSVSFIIFHQTIVTGSS